MDSTLTTGSVVVGVDGSPGSDVALTWAADQARSEARHLLVVHTVASPVVTDFAIDLVASRADLVAGGRRITDLALERVNASHPDVVTTALVLVGDPRVQLAEAAAEASLLVLGSRGRGAVASLLLGSVSVALAAHAPCPVVVARPPTREIAAIDLSVVVGVDAGADSPSALLFAFELAASQLRPLEVIHALGNAWLFPYPDGVSPELVRETVDAADDVVTGLLEGLADKFPDVVVRRRLEQETPTQALVDASREASVVVVGCRGRGTVRSRVLGSVSRAVVEHAHCTVAVIGEPRTAGVT
ncbi:MAG: universal stress protein [Nocardioidaceae bacterium]